MKSWKLSIKKLHEDYDENFNKIGQEMTTVLPGVEVINLG
jgi:hypothetical protein